MSHTFRDEKIRRNEIPFVMAYFRKKNYRKLANRSLRRKIKRGLEVQNGDFKKVEEVDWNVL
jgi:hypothetical protein